MNTKKVVTMALILIAGLVLGFVVANYLGSFGQAKLGLVQDRTYQGWSVTVRDN